MYLCFLFYFKDGINPLPQIKTIGPWEDSPAILSPIPTHPCVHGQAGWALNLLQCQWLGPQLDASALHNSYAVQKVPGV